MLTKAQELDIYSAFLQSLPRNSYLADLLADTLPLIEDAIRSDLAMPGTLSQLHQFKRDADAELKTVRAEIEKARQELAVVQQRTARIERNATAAVADADQRLAKIRDDMRQLCSSYAR